MLNAPAVRTVIRALLFLAGLGVLIVLVLGLDINEIVRLIARTGWNLALILLIYGGCQMSRAAALWLCQPRLSWCDTETCSEFECPPKPFAC